MAGINPGQAAVPSMVDLLVAMNNFAQAASLVTQEQRELLALLRAKNAKAPAIFGSGTLFDALQNYMLALPGTVGNYYGENTEITVLVLNIGGADVVEITGGFTVSASDGDQEPDGLVNIFLMGALSPSDQLNQIPVDQFFNIRGSTAYGVAENDNGQFAITQINFSDSIQSAGNKYLHIWGIVAHGGQFDPIGGSNTWTDLFFQDDSAVPPCVAQGAVTYRLIR